MIHQVEDPDDPRGSTNTVVERAARRAEDKGEAIDQKSNPPRAVSAPVVPEEDQPPEGQDQPEAMAPGVHRLARLQQIRGVSPSRAEGQQRYVLVQPQPYRLSQARGGATV